MHPSSSQALTEALDRAFPDLPRDQLPWPEHEQRLTPGTGWVAPPAPRPLTYRDPAELIAKIAAVRGWGEGLRRRGCTPKGGGEGSGVEGSG